MLEALHPGRIDLGIGRAPGYRSAHRRRRCAAVPSARRRRLPRQTRPSSSATSGARGRKATGTRASPWCPGAATSPQSGCSGRARTERRTRPCSALPFSFAYHFAPAVLMDALEVYRRDFPSVGRARRAVRDARCDGGVRGERRARALAGRAGAARVPPAASGRPDVYPTPEEAAEYSSRPPSARSWRTWTGSHVVGDLAPCAPASTTWSRAPAPTNSWSRRWCRRTPTGWRRTRVFADAFSLERHPLTGRASPTATTR